MNATTEEKADEAIEMVSEAEAAAPPFKREIRVWVCPDPGCPNYYGSSASHDVDLTTSTNIESDMRHTATTKPGNTEVVGNRGECPYCKSSGRSRQRIPMAFVVTVDPGQEPEAPDWAKRGALELDRPRA